MISIVVLISLPSCFSTSARRASPEIGHLITTVTRTLDGPTRIATASSQGSVSENPEQDVASSPTRCSALARTAMKRNLKTSGSRMMKTETEMKTVHAWSSSWAGSAQIWTTAPSPWKPSARTSWTIALLLVGRGRGQPRLPIRGQLGHVTHV